MAKTYNTISSVSTGDVYTATQHNSIVTNVNNYRVPPMARITKNGTTRPYTSATAIAFDNGTTNGYDTDGMYSAGANTRLTVQTAGVYLVVACIFTAWEVGSIYGSAGWQFLLRRNAAQIGPGDQVTNIDQTAVAYRSGLITQTVSCAVGDYFDMNLMFSGASTMNVYGDTTSVGCTSLSLTWLGQAS